MESLNKKILLEFLEDEVEDIPEDEIENINISDLDVENPIAKTLCPTFTIDTLNSLLTDTQSIFNYLNTYVQDEATTDPNGTNILDQISEEDKEQVPVLPRKVATIDKTSVKVNGVAIQNAEDVKLKKDDIITYEITVSNAGNRDLTGVTVTDDHDVRFVKVEKVNAD